MKNQAALQTENNAEVIRLYLAIELSRIETRLAIMRAAKFEKRESLRASVFGLYAP